MLFAALEPVGWAFMKYLVFSAAVICHQCGSVAHADFGRSDKSNVHADSDLYWDVSVACPNCGVYKRPPFSHAEPTDTTFTRLRPAKSRVSG